VGNALGDGFTVHNGSTNTAEVATDTFTINILPGESISGLAQSIDVNMLTGITFNEYEEYGDYVWIEVLPDGSVVWWIIGTWTMFIKGFMTATALTLTMLCFKLLRFLRASSSESLA